MLFPFNPLAVDGNSIFKIRKGENSICITEQSSSTVWQFVTAWDFNNVQPCSCVNTRNLDLLTIWTGTPFEKIARIRNLLFKNSDLVLWRFQLWRKNLKSIEVLVVFAFWASSWSLRSSLRDYNFDIFASHSSSLFVFSCWLSEVSSRKITVFAS